MPPPPRIPPRDGPWIVVDDIDPRSYPLLDLPADAPRLTIVYRGPHPWEPWVMVAPSAVLSKLPSSRRRRCDPGMGLYALRRFPKATIHRESTIGYYGGKVVGHGRTEREAIESIPPANRTSTYILAMQKHGHKGWLAVDGARDAVPPLLHRANDPRGTRYEPRCRVTPHGRFEPIMDIPLLDLKRPLRDQARSEITWSYGESYWNQHRAEGCASPGSS